nr:hypothetical protein BaRGS_034673 [Batillaria attramentaria]
MAAARYEYHWCDGVNYKKPTALPAPQYISLLMEWVESQINDESLFPVQVGHPFPKNYQSVVKKILKRLFRVFVHVYIHHFDKLVAMGAEAHINTCYKHFYYFVQEYNLIDKKELEPLVGSHKVHMSRGYEAAAPAYDRHLRMVKQQYGDQVIINLLGIKEGERMLSQAFQNHHKASAHQLDVSFIHFDYHSEIKGSNLKNLERLKAKLIKQLHSYDFFFSSSISNGECSRQQTGTMRTNCLDCLDRTNAVQTMIGLEMLPRQLECLGLAAKPQMVSRFEEVYRQIWGHNGDHISRIYAGTGALGGGRSKYTDATRSATRAIQNNFLDSSKQEAIDVLLTGSSLYGDLADKARALLSSRYLHASPSILQSMVERAAEYTRSQPLRICVATYNVNGGSHFRSIIHKNVSLTDWLLDAHKTHTDSMVEGYDYDTPVDIFAVGFEEIVDLNASNIMKASTTNANEWRKEVMKTISRDHKYVELVQIQLVGVILFIFFRPHLAPLIRDVAVDKVKTGLGGATGNKGGVGIRFLINSTSFCFVCAHLAAGQSNVTERNDDYMEITRRMTFPMGRTILSHDYVFWCGDFNYRIDLPNEEVKQYASEQNWEHSKDSTEAPTNFAPTYKYDMFSDDWDTSEKARTPAWTDRVLWRYRPPPGCSPDQIKQLLYTRAELRMSDHRPVVALFHVETQEVVESKKEAVLQEVVGQQGPPDATVIISLATDGEFEDDVVQEIVDRFTEVGDVIIVRFVGADMWVLYKSGHDALEALQLDQQTIGGQVISVRLKTETWRAEIEKELQLCAANTGALYNAFTNSLLGDDFSVPSMEFDMGDEVKRRVLELMSLSDDQYPHPNRVLVVWKTYSTSSQLATPAHIWSQMRPLHPSHGLDRSAEETLPQPQ